MMRRRPGRTYYLGVNDNHMIVSFPVLEEEGEGSAASDESASEGGPVFDDDYEILDGADYEAGLVERALVDTGSPLSLSTAGPIVLLGQSYTVSETGLVSLKQLNDTVPGRPFKWFLGMDLMWDFVVTINWSAHKFSLSSASSAATSRSGRAAVWRPPTGSDVVKLGTMYRGGPPIIAQIQLPATSHECTAIVDTGAKVSYCKASLLDAGGYDICPNERATDFYPGFGKWTTELYQTPVIVGQQVIVVKFGKLPKELDAVMFMMSDVVLGSDLFAQTTEVGFNFQAKTMWIIP
ncbi:hypothetical protein Pelo_9812 [Pelomyxa schiedti]|nr:hypothetical protein Pelo_9812 [Pelomyxa schiedti]